MCYIFLLHCAHLMDYHCYAWSSVGSNVDNGVILNVKYSNVKTCHPNIEGSTTELMMYNTQRDSDQH
jgi:hypothetical protein